MFWEAQIVVFQLYEIYHRHEDFVTVWQLTILIILSACKDLIYLLFPIFLILFQTILEIDIFQIFFNRSESITEILSHLLFFKS